MSTPPVWLKIKRRAALYELVARKMSRFTVEGFANCDSKATITKTVLD